MSYIEQSREPLRPVVDTVAALDECLAALASAEGPVAFDTERAHGHRYWPRAYLLQIRRAGAGTWLIDPIAFREAAGQPLSELVSSCADATWLLHAASQDLPCMTELGIVPPSIFDTEMAARLLGKPSAGLGPLLESELGIHLRKAHSADNWSRRPLPESWLVYAALDVDYLIELAQLLHGELIISHREGWAAEEDVETLRRGTAEPTPKQDPWRRLSGLTTLRTARQLAVARALWQAREAVAQRRDRPPTWLLPDAAILEAAAASRDAVISDNRAEQGALGRQPGRRFLKNWFSALDEVRRMPESQYPTRRPPRDGVPPPRAWAKIDPDAANRWDAVRPIVDELACDLGLQQPSLVAPPKVLQAALFVDEPVTQERLIELGARHWQARFLAPAIDQALSPLSA